MPFNKESTKLLPVLDYEANSNYQSKYFTPNSLRAKRHLDFSVDIDQATHVRRCGYRFRGESH